MQPDAVSHEFNKYKGASDQKTKCCGALPPVPNQPQ